MVATVELTDLLNRRDVLGFFHNADHRGVTTLVPADAALVLFCDVAASPAELDPFQDLEQRGRQPAHVGRIGGYQVKRDALRALRPYAGQLAELVDEVLDDAFIHLRTPRLPSLPVHCSSSLSPGASLSPAIPASGPIASCCRSLTAS